MNLLQNLCINEIVLAVDSKTMNLNKVIRILLLFNLTDHLFTQYFPYINKLIKITFNDESHFFINVYVFTSFHNINSFHIPNIKKYRKYRKCSKMANYF